MKKICITLAVSIVVIAICLAAYTQEKPTRDWKDTPFTLRGETVNLKDNAGTIRYFGDELRHDVDGDGADDVVFLITEEPGGSGTFFFAVAALKRADGYIGSHAVLLGDRIAPQNLQKGTGRRVIFNYADRAPGEPMSTKPSVGKSMHLLLDTKTLEFGEVVQNFEGESR